MLREGFSSWLTIVSLVCISRLMSKWSHFMLWPVIFSWSAMADEWSLSARALKCSVFLRKEPCSVYNSQKDMLILLPYLGLQRNQVTKRLKSCVHRFYSFVNLKIAFQSTRRIKSYFHIHRSLETLSRRSRVIYKAGCWDCQINFTVENKTKPPWEKNRTFQGPR